MFLGDLEVGERLVNNLTTGLYEVIRVDSNSVTLVSCDNVFNGFYFRVEIISEVLDAERLFGLDLYN